MKIKKGFVLREVAGNFIVVPTGSLVKSFNGVVNLNQTGAFLWSKCSEEIDREYLKKELMAEYQIDEETALKGVDKFIETVKKEEFVD